jgi:regulator of RNase E activity RraA
MIPPTSSISDALDSLGFIGQVPGLRPIAAGMRARGRAFTLRFAGHLHAGQFVGDYIDDVPAGSILVLANEGRTDCSVWGELLTCAALRRSIAGVVIDGVCRDSAVIRQLGFPLFSRGAFMRTGKDRVALQAREVTVRIGGIDVSPGDLIAADDDGVVAVPRAMEEQVLSRAREIDEAESRIREALASGSRLDEARAANNYFDLQRRGR